MSSRPVPARSRQAVELLSPSSLSQSPIPSYDLRRLTSASSNGGSLVPQMIEPIYAALERGEKLNIYFELAEDFHGLDSGALWQDVKAAGSVGLKHRSSWERMALVTDKDWVRHGASAFGWLAPGELRLFEPSEREEARAWLGARSSP
jgi:SpoIIAA-like